MSDTPRDISPEFRRLQEDAHVGETAPEKTPSTSGTSVAAN